MYCIKSKAKIGLFCVKSKVIKRIICIKSKVKDIVTRQSVCHFTTIAVHFSDEPNNKERLLELTPFLAYICLSN